MKRGDDVPVPTQPQVGKAVNVLIADFCYSKAAQEGFEVGDPHAIMPIVLAIPANADFDKIIDQIQNIDGICGISTYDGLVVERNRS